MIRTRVLELLIAKVIILIKGTYVRILKIHLKMVIQEKLILIFYATQNKKRILLNKSLMAIKLQNATCIFK